MSEIHEIKSLGFSLLSSLPGNTVLTLGYALEEYFGLSCDLNIKSASDSACRASSQMYFLKIHIPDGSACNTSFSERPDSFCRKYRSVSTTSRRALRANGSR